MSWGTIPIHGYGIIVGLAVVVVWQLLEQLSQRWSVPARLAHQWGWVVVGALIGARVWHLWTDWALYQPLIEQGQWWQLLAVWQGGLSVLGAVVGMLLVVRILGGKNWLVGTDVLALALPWGQVIGRFANWWNQELYGLPTTLPWGIWIDTAHRLPSVVTFNRFHPLFAYEAIGVSLLGWWLWHHQTQETWQPGSGRLMTAYLAGYSWLRFSLDFLRVERPVIWGGLSQNQWSLVVVGIVSTVLLLFPRLGSQLIQLCKVCISRYAKYMAPAAFSKKTSRLSVRAPWVLVGIGMALLLGVWMGRAVQNAWRLNQALRAAADGATVQVTIRRGEHHVPITAQPLRIKLAKTDQSRTAGLSGLTSLPGDGMAFWFDHSAQWLFWMKDMQFNLDFVWIRQDRVVGVTTQVLAPTSSTEPLTTFGPPAPIDLVLELAAGRVNQLGIRPGDSVVITPVQ